MKYSVKLVHRTTKTLSTGKNPVYLRITINRKTKDYSLGSTYACFEDQWNPGKEMFNYNYSGYDDSNGCLENVKNKAKKILHTLEEKRKGYTLYDFDKLFSRDTDAIIVLKYMDSIIKDLKSNDKFGNALVYRDTRNSIETFIKLLSKFKNGNIDYSILNKQYITDIRKETRIDMPLSSIDYKFLKQYESFLAKLTSSVSVHLRFRTLRAVFNKAIKEERFDYYPFKEYTFNHISTKTQKRALKLDELKKLFNFKVKPGTRKYDSLNYFKFMYFSRGMNFADVANLKKSDIDKDRFSYTRAKTHKFIKNVHLFGESKKIIKHFSKYTADSEYVFPILFSTHNTIAKQKNRTKDILKDVNKDLQDIAAEIGINKKITTYVSRHSFATILRYLGEPDAMIGELLDQKDEKSTKIYLDEFEENTLKDSARKAITALQ